MTFFLSLFRYKTITVMQNQRILVLNKGKLNRILTVGEHSVHIKDDICETFNLAQNEFQSQWKEAILSQEPKLLEENFQLISTDKNEVALVYLKNKLIQYVGQAEQKLYWKDIGELKVEKYDVSQDLTIPEVLLPTLSRSLPQQNYTSSMNVVPQHNVGVVTIDNKFHSTVPAGKYAYWSVGKTVKIDIVDLRMAEVEVSGQEIMTKDKVGVRVNLSFFYAVQDVLKALQSSVKYQDTIYKIAQFALREAIGTKTLDDILASKDELDNFITTRLQSQALELGLQVQKAGIKDIILPGEIREMFNLVTKAERVANANLIKRREETAATRSLLNTVKLMEENPMLLRMKELETLEKLTEKVGSLTVFGGLEGMLSELLKIKAN